MDNYLTEKHSVVLEYYINYIKRHSLGMHAQTFSELPPEIREALQLAGNYLTLADDVTKFLQKTK